MLQNNAAEQRVVSARSRSADCDTTNCADLTKHEIDWQLHFAKPMEDRLLEGRSKEVALEAVYQ